MHAHTTVCIIQVLVDCTLQSAKHAHNVNGGVASGSLQIPVRIRMRVNRRDFELGDFCLVLSVPY